MADGDSFQNLMNEGDGQPAWRIPSRSDPNASFFVCFTSAFQNVHRHGQRLRIAKKRRKWMERGGWGGREKQQISAAQQASCLQSCAPRGTPSFGRVCEDGSRSRSQAQVAAGRISEDRQGRWCHVGTLRRGRSDLLLDRAP